MGQATSQIEAHIEHTRADLGSNLQELEQKVKAVTDWKQHFQKNPLTLLGVAFGGGIVLATMSARRRTKDRDSSYKLAPAYEPYAGRDHKTRETWDNIKGALIGVAAKRFKDFVGEVVPGFHEQFRRAEEEVKAGRPPAAGMNV